MAFKLRYFQAEAFGATNDRNGSIPDEIETAPRLPLTCPKADISDGTIVLRRSNRLECPFSNL